MRVVVAADNADLRNQLRQAALGAGLECSAEDCVPLADLVGRLPHSSPGLVIVDVGTDLPTGRAAIQAVASGPPVLAVGTTTDPQEVLHTIRCGAREQIHRDRVREELPEALRRIWPAGNLMLRRGRVLAVTGAVPGCGVTTVATNLAFALGQEYSGQVALAELSDDAPTLALSLDLQPRNSVSELLRHWERLDATMVRQTAVEHARGVHVLAHPPETLTGGALEPPAVRQAVTLLRSLYEFTVLDLGHRASDAALEAMTLADSVITVVRIDVPSLRLCRQFLRELARRGVEGDKVRLVANRYGQKRQLAWRRVEEVVGLPVMTWIPEDPATLNEAVNHGLPLVDAARRARITRRFDQMAGELNGRTKGQAGRS